MVDSTGNVVAKYKYDLWGVQTKESGTKEAEFGYGGYYVHRPSGLYLTWYRQYDPSIARWLSRDPIGEQGGLNLYAYVGNEPTGYIDPKGLEGTPVDFPIHPNDELISPKDRKKFMEGFFNALNRLNQPSCKNFFSK
jgi:RHS repeat-associated protein